MATTTPVAVTIPDGESLSNAVDCNVGSLIGIVYPLDLPADDDGKKVGIALTFQISFDGEAFSEIFDDQGQAVSVQIYSGAAIPVPDFVNKWTQALRYIRFRTGTSDKPSVQQSDWTFTAVMELPSPYQS